MPKPPPGLVIGYDPSVKGLPADIGTTVYDSGGVFCWQKYGTSNTAWRASPVSAIVASDPSQSPGLKAPIGFVVTLTDGSASWVKSGAGDMAWTPNAGVADPARGTDLTDASATINPASDAASIYVLPASVPLTVNRTLTLGVTGSPVTNSVVTIVRRGGGAFTYIVTDDASTTLFTFSASATKQAVSFYFDGTHFKLLSFVYVS